MVPELCVNSMTHGSFPPRGLGLTPHPSWSLTEDIHLSVQDRGHPSLLVIDRGHHLSVQGRGHKTPKVASPLKPVLRL